MAESSIQDWLARLPEHFLPEMAEGVDTVLQMRLSGEGGGEWYVTIAGKQISWSEGTASNPRLTLTGSAQDVLKILDGRLDAMRAYMLGKVKVQGDLGFAMKLVKLFKA